VTARLVPLAELTTAEVGAWRELADRAIAPNPFFDPDYVLPAARGLGDFDRVGLAVVEQDGEWAACQPVRRYTNWHHLPLPCLGTWRHRYCLLGTPLVSPGEDGGVQAMTESMRGARGSTFAALEWLSADGPIGTDVDELAPSPIPFEDFSRAMLLRRRSNDYLDGRLKGKHRREFRRISKGLEEQLGGELELVDRAGDPDAVEAFLELESSGWKGRSATALAADPGHADFFREMTAAMASRGALELFFLEAGGKVAAARCSLLAGGGSFCFKVAFDEELKRFSPGRELELQLIDRFHDSGRLQWMDSCADPGNQLFNRLWPDRRRLQTVACRSRGPLGAFVPPALRAVAAARDRRRRGALD
jgi:CelD/BcsL family acetyltransferase involved in cellulose biosynthesis